MSPELLRLPELLPHRSIEGAVAAPHDVVIVVGQAPLSKALASRHPGAAAQPVVDALSAVESLDASLADGKGTVALLPAPVPGGRVVAATTGPLASWELDVRLFAQAAAAGIARAVAAGAKRPLLVVCSPDGDARYARALDVAVLGALGSIWEPLELRWGKARAAKIEALGVVGLSDEAAARATSLERGRVVARDICGTEPATMLPDAVARYCVEVFSSSTVRVDVLSDLGEIKKRYPLIHAVARASTPVEAHWPRVIRLAYEGEGPITRSYFFAGKGLTYDTGGADLKVDGHMAGMSRDKGGAAAVAGLFRVLAERRPRGVRVVGLLGAVRNDIGPHAYVSDELVTSRAGVRVRIGNTDAEGRLVLAELLAALREEAEGAPSPSLFSVATLTGHAALAHGPYTALVPNGAAERAGLCEAIERAGDALFDPIERSRLRPEDYAFVAGKSAAEDVLSCNTLPSSRTPRGHQFPAAFLDIVSGLRAKNAQAAAPMPFVHVDIAGSAVGGGSWASGTPTAAPVLALAEGLSLVG